MQYVAAIGRNLPSVQLQSGIENHREISRGTYTSDPEFDRTNSDDYNQHKK